MVAESVGRSGVVGLMLVEVWEGLASHSKSQVGLGAANGWTILMDDTNSWELGARWYMPTRAAHLWRSAPSTATLWRCPGRPRAQHRHLPHRLEGEVTLIMFR